ncbi:MAG: phosphatidate cytidylyltransferase [Hyphomicrobiaceae bacterium]|nr:phosphatidate cytidylyltransferase [Hyphomicrobiaceae bacterium]
MLHGTGPTAKPALASAPGGAGGGLAKRIASAGVLGGLALVAVAAGGFTFAGFVAAIALVVGWEWGRIVRSRAGDLSFGLHAAASLVAIGAAALARPGLALVIIVVMAGLLTVMNYGRGGRLSGAGVLYTGLPAVILLTMRHSEAYGFFAVLFILLVVWSADTAAYAGGRAVGGAKLWPSISPNKTWAGLVSALGASLVMGVALQAAWPLAPLGHLPLVAVLLGLSSQAGDLAESALKRLFKVKDASNLIPGHGGFLDRVDSVVAAAIVAAVIGLALAPDDPARGLVTGAGAVAEGIVAAL